MTAADEYRKRAAECAAHARREADPALQAEWEAMARSYRRLAEQADRNSQTDAIYEPPSLGQPDAEQVQRQPQSKLKPEE